MTSPIDILGIGNAIVDVIVTAEHDVLARWNMHPGSMTLIDEQRAHALTDALAQQGAIRRSGGSAANTCVVAAMLGANVAYLGKVADDLLGAAFTRDIGQAGVRFAARPFVTGAPTARCFILVTPDGQRTMNTFLGAATALTPDDIDDGAIGAASIVYLEGYLFDPPSAQAAFRRAAASARRVAISLSDAFCVERHRDAFRDFVRDHAHIVFANEAEIRALYQEHDIARCADQLADDVELGIITHGADGSLVVHGAERLEIPAAPATVVDTTGAGDAYAAGFLAALVRGLPLADAGRIASVAAAEIISHFGARPEAELRMLAGL